MRRGGEGGDRCCMSTVTESWRLGCRQDPRAPPDRDIDSDVYVLVALVIAHSRNANLCYVLSEPLKFNGKPPPTVT